MYGMRKELPERCTLTDWSCGGNLQEMYLIFLWEKVIIAMRLGAANHQTGNEEYMKKLSFF